MKTKANDFCVLVGPCALDYTKMKTSDHFWTDPPADELVQRHRIHSGTTHHMTAGSPQSPKRLGLQVRYWDGLLNRDIISILTHPPIACIVSVESPEARPADKIWRWVGVQKHRTYYGIPPMAALCL